MGRQMQRELIGEINKSLFENVGKKKETVEFKLLLEA